MLCINFDYFLIKDYLFQLLSKSMLQTMDRIGVFACTGAISAKKDLRMPLNFGHRKFQKFLNLSKVYPKLKTSEIFDS